MSAKIGVIISTTRPTRVGRHVAEWFMSRVADTDGLEFELIDLQEWDLPFLSEPESPSTGNYTQEIVKKWSAKIDSLDGFVFVTAEYNNGPPAPLKNAIDTVYNEWNRKPVAFVGYGGYGATRAVEQLVDTASKIGMVPLSKTFVSLLSPWDSVKKDGSVDESFVQGKVEGLVDNLKWWADLLKTARTS